MSDVVATNPRELPWPAVGYISKTIAFNTTGIGTDQTVEVGQLPEGARVIDGVVYVTTAFNAATTNVLTVGTGTSTNEYFGSSDVTEGTPAGYAMPTANRGIVVGTGGAIVYVKYTQTGTAATTGAATVILTYITRVG